MVVLKKPNDKGRIYGNIKKLQDKQNSQNGYYQVEDQLPARETEVKRKQRHILWRNKKTVAFCLMTSFKKGQLVIDNQRYKTMIQIPDAAWLLKLKPDEVRELKKLDV